MALRFLSILIYLIASMSLSAQTATIEKLEKELQKAQGNEERLQLVFRLCEENQSLGTEAYRHYVSLAVKVAALLDNPYYKDLASAEQSFLLARDQRIDTALSIVNTLLKKYERSGKSEFISRLLMLKGRVLDRGFRRMDNIDVNLQRMEECEKYRDTLCLVMSMNSIGWSYLELGKNSEALYWLQKALGLNYSNHLALRKYNCLYSNTALAYFRLGKQDSARHFIELAIRYGRETETLTFLSNSLGFRAQMLMRTEPAEAKAALDEALEIRKRMGDPYYILFTLLELAEFHHFEKDYEKSIALCNEGIAIAYRSGLTTKLPELYQLLANNYQATGNQTEGIRILRQLVAIKDSLNNVYAASLSDIETRYAVQKKENVIMEQRFDLAKKNYLLTGSIVLLLVVVIAAFFIFRANRRRQVLKMQVMMEEEKRLAALAVSEAEEAERKRIAADLHDNLGAQANAILYGTELLQQDETNGVLVEDLHHTAKDMLSSLRETLWVLKNTDVTAADIWLRIINFSKQINRHYPQIEILTQGVPPEVLQLTSTQALNIVFIVQEAVNNAVRHSGAGKVIISTQASEQLWNIEVRDDGSGFDISLMSQKQESYGLSNMKERARSAGMILEMDTGLQLGTSITLVISRTTGA